MLKLIVMLTRIGKTISEQTTKSTHTATQEQHFTKNPATDSMESNADSTSTVTMKSPTTTTRTDKISTLPDDRVCFDRIIFNEDGSETTKKVICIKVVTSESTTWNKAETYCSKNFGGHLASIASAAENADIYRAMMAASPQSNPSNYCWIGSYDYGCLDKGNFQFQWTDGSPNSYSNWIPGEPNSQHKECCTHLWSKHPEMWNNAACSASFPCFVCQYVAGYSVVAVFPTFDDVRTTRAIDGPCFQRKSTDENGLVIETEVCTEVVHDVAVTWTQAENQCVVNYKGHLVSISNVNENSAIHQSINASGVTGPECWIGLSDDGCLDGTGFLWRWTDGAHMIYTNWLSGEPNYKHKECCTHLYMHSDVKDSYWNNRECSNVFSCFICEYDVQSQVIDSTVSQTESTTLTTSSSLVLSTASDALPTICVTHLPNTRGQIKNVSDDGKTAKFECPIGYAIKDRPAVTIICHRGAWKYVYDDALNLTCKRASVIFNKFAEPDDKQMFWDKIDRCISNGTCKDRKDAISRWFPTSTKDNNESKPKKSQPISSSQTAGFIAMVIGLLTAAQALLEIILYVREIRAARAAREAAGHSDDESTVTDEEEYEYYYEEYFVEEEVDDFYLSPASLC